MVLSVTPDRSSPAGTHPTGLGLKRRLAPASRMASDRSSLNKVAPDGAHRACCVQARSKSSPFRDWPRKAVCPEVGRPPISTRASPRSSQRRFTGACALDWPCNGEYASADRHRAPVTHTASPARRVWSRQPDRAAVPGSVAFTRHARAAAPVEMNWPPLDRADTNRAAAGRPAEQRFASADQRSGRNG